MKMPKYKFEDIAFNITRKRKPTVDDMTTYIGLEHLDSGVLAVTRWGSKVPIKGDKLVMEKGDVLFGKRNAYLRRAAIAPHDGLFSAHGMILRPNEEVISRKLFPFFICSDYFFDAAIRISVGSLSPTINWSALKELEFIFPDMNEQEKLADLLWAANNTKEAYKKLFYLTDELVKSQFIEMFGDPVTNPMGWLTKPLLETGNCKNGMNFASNESGTQMHCLGVGDFKDLSEIRDTSILPMISLNSKPSAGYLLQNEDIVFVRSNGNKELVGRCIAIYPQQIPTTYSGFCIRYRRTLDTLQIPYLLQVFKSPSVRQKMVGRGANIQNLNQQILSQIEIPIPPVDLQKQFNCLVQQLDKSKFELEQSIVNLENTIKALMSKTFG